MGLPGHKLEVWTRMRVGTGRGGGVGSVSDGMRLIGLADHKLEVLHQLAHASLDRGGEPVVLHERQHEPDRSGYQTKGAFYSCEV